MKAAVIVAMGLAGCAPLGTPNGTITLRNESGRAVRSVEINVVDGGYRGRFQEKQVSPYDQLLRLGALKPDDERVLKYFTTAEFNIDTRVTWQDGQTARFRYGYLEGGWDTDTHIIVIEPTGILFDGKPPIPAQRDPERNYGRTYGDPWLPSTSPVKPPESRTPYQDAILSNNGDAFWGDVDVLKDTFDHDLAPALPASATAIEKGLQSCELWATRLDDSLEGGSLYAFICDGHLAKMQATNYMETGKYRADFYVTGDTLLFARATEVRYAMGDGADIPTDYGRFVSVATATYAWDVQGGGFQAEMSTALRDGFIRYRDITKVPENFAKMRYVKGEWIREPVPQ